MIRITAACVLLILILSFSVQRQSAHQSEEQCPVKWDWRHAEELSWKQSISRSKLEAAEKERLITSIAEQLREWASDFGPSSEGDRRRAAAEARIRYADLDGDGTPEVIVQAGDEGSCSPTGNCPFWVLHLQRGKYEVLAKAEAQTFTIQPTRSNSFFDILLTTHGSVSESGVTIYQFNGRAYRERTSCIAEWGKEGSDGKYHHFEEPHLTLYGTGLR